MFVRMMNDLSPLMRLPYQMDRLLETFFDDSPTTRGYAASYPGMNLWEEGDTAYVEAELPGMSMDEIEIYVAGKELTISGERKISGVDNASYQRRERAAGRFSRVMTLPWEINADKVEAKLVNGVLTVALPKCESCKPKKIQIQALPTT
jgi:HSP20 family protein